MKQQLNINQWESTANVIDWFNNTERKSTCSCAQFDIVEFYSSNLIDLLAKSLDYAKCLTTIIDDNIPIIMHAKKSLLLDKEVSWIKKNGENMFEVTMGCFDGAEICKLVCLFILHKLGQKHYNLDIGLY